MICSHLLMKDFTRIQIKLLQLLRDCYFSPSVKSGRHIVLVIIKGAHRGRKGRGTYLPMENIYKISSFKHLLLMLTYSSFVKKITLGKNFQLVVKIANLVGIF